MNPDCELLRRYAEEADDAAFTEVVRRHVNLVFASAVRLLNGNAAMAQDVTQVVFTDLARKAGALTQHTSLAGWLHTSVRFAAANAVRTEQRRRLREQEASAMSDQTNVLETAWMQMRPLIDEAVGQLHEPERNAILLRFFEEKSHREVGAALGLTENAARMRVERGLEKLRTHLVRHGITASVVLLAATLSTHAASAPAPAALLAATVSSKALLGAGPPGGTSLTKAGLHLFWGTKAQVALAASAAVVSLTAAALVFTQAGAHHSLSAKHSPASSAPMVAPSAVFVELQDKMANPPDVLAAASALASSAATTLATTGSSATTHLLQSAPQAAKPLAGTNADEAPTDDTPESNVAPIADNPAPAPMVQSGPTSPPAPIVIAPPAPPVVVMAPPQVFPSVRIEKMVQWSPRLGGNGHYYLAVAEPGGITWVAAQAYAAQRGGHLATIASRDENDFVFNLVNAPQFWRLAANKKALLGPWLGGIHSGSVNDMAYGWHWINNGETISFANWAPQEPGANGNRLHFFAWGGNPQPTWDNDPAQGLMPGFVVEFDGRPQPLLAASPPAARPPTPQNQFPLPQNRPAQNVPRGTFPVIISNQHQPMPPALGSLPGPRLNGPIPGNRSQPLAMTPPFNRVTP
jgi:RNA polymerase sigma factor (sigma-70 family)